MQTFKENIARSALAAKAIRNGMTVDVIMDDGSVVTTQSLSDPWQLGHGGWVIKLAGFSGGYNCARVSPSKTPDTDKAGQSSRMNKTRIQKRG